MFRRDYRCFLVSILRLKDETAPNSPENIEDKRVTGVSLFPNSLIAYKRANKGPYCRRVFLARRARAKFFFSALVNLRFTHLINRVDYRYAITDRHIHRLALEG